MEDNHFYKVFTTIAITILHVDTYFLKSLDNYIFVLTSDNYMFVLTSDNYILQPKLTLTPIKYRDSPIFAGLKLIIINMH